MPLSVDFFKYNALKIMVNVLTLSIPISKTFLNLSSGKRMYEVMKLLRQNKYIYGYS